jgi:hypothetical protein
MSRIVALALATGLALAGQAQAQRPLDRGGWEGHPCVDATQAGCVGSPEWEAEAERARACADAARAAGWEGGDAGDALRACARAATGR